MTPKSSTDLLPEYRRLRNLELEKFIESFLSEDRKNILRSTIYKRTRHITLVAERFFDEYNIHALIRSSESFGLQDFYNIPYENVHLKKNKSVTRGAFQWTNVHSFSEYTDSSVACIEHLKRKGYTVYASSSNLKTINTAWNIPLNKPIAIMMGNEHKGISPEALKHVDDLITIPMYGFTESFNVSVAGAIMLSIIVERLRQSNLQYGLSITEQEELYYQWLWYSIKNPDVLYKEWLVHNS